jgi:hypothetical protein
MRTHNPGVWIPLLFSAWLVVWAAAGCSDPTVWERTVTISGDVVEASTGEPLDSAWAALGDTLLPDARWYSGTEGRFSVTSTPFRLPLPLHVGRKGYLTVTDTLENVQSDVGGLHYELEPAQ